MMTKIFFGAIAILIVLPVHLSCKKDLSCEGCRDGNKAPIATAGPDQVITLPTDSVLLDGASSSDPDGMISEWFWRKISGPASFTISKPNAINTIVTNLAEGIYEFELKMTDDGGLSAKDSVRVVVYDPAKPNQTPVAKAGPDQTITPPENTATLDGSWSTDQDNNIIDYEWRKISGPEAFSIANAHLAQTQVNNLTEGVYEFELKVTDAGGLSAKDTLSINLNHDPASSCDISDWPIINLKLTEIGRLSEPRIPVIGSAGGKIVFAGGPKNLACTWEWEHSSSAVDIYDINSHVWTTAQLSKERSGMSAISNGNKIFFAGGVSWDNHGGSWWNESYDNIDIYDVSTNTWTVAHLSKAREGISAATIGNKVIFAGGSFYTGNPTSNNVWGVTNVIDIYDISTNSQSTTSLSVPRAGSVNLIKGDSVYFIGGWGRYNAAASNAVDIYNGSTDTWSAFTWSEEKINKFLTDAGLLNGPAAKPCGCGTTASGIVTQIGFYNTVTGRCAIGILPQFPSGMSGASGIVVNNKDYYAGGYSEDNRGCYVLSDKVYVIDW